MYASTQGGGLTDMGALGEVVFSMGDSQAAGVVLPHLDHANLTPPSLVLASSSGHVSCNGTGFCTTQPPSSLGQPNSPGMYIATHGCNHLGSIAATQPSILLQQPMQTYSMTQDQSSLSMLPPMSTAVPLEIGMGSEMEYDTSLLLQLQQLQLDQQQQQLQQLLAEREEELEQLRMLVQQQGHQQQEVVLADSAQFSLIGSAASAQEAVLYYQGGSVAAAEGSLGGAFIGPVSSGAAATPAAPSQPGMYLLQPPREAASQRRHSMLQLPLDPLQLVSDGASQVRNMDGAERTRRYSMVQLQPNTSLSAFEAGAGAAGIDQPGRVHRAPLRAASWGANTFRDSVTGIMGVHSTMHSSDAAAAEPIAETGFYRQSQIPAPAGGIAPRRNGPLLHQGYSRPRRNSMHQASGPHNLVMVAEDAVPPFDEGAHQRHAPNRVASWAAQTFSRRVDNASRGSVDLPRPNDGAAAANRNAAGYEQSEGTGCGFTGGVAGPSGGPQHGQRASSLASDAAANRARRNSVEAPKWAGAFWNPMVSGPIL